MNKETKSEFSSLHASRESKILQIKKLSEEEYGRAPKRLQKLLDDICDLYAGQWQSHEACQVGYHTLTHALDVTLATGRMIAGWNSLHTRKIGAEYFLLAVAAALFHDSGYIKDKGDTKGRGGKYTFSHVPRSMEIARHYMISHGWPPNACAIVPEIIGQTEFSLSPELEDKFEDSVTETVTRMVATADLVAQMSDVNYMQHIKDLFQEFQEAYQAEGEKALKKRGIRIYSSAEEMIHGSLSFYSNFVLPKLAQLGGMSRYLIAYYGEGRNPYLESIAANLKGEAGGYHPRWRYIGEILTELGAVTEKQLEDALRLQKKNKEDRNKVPRAHTKIKVKAKEWIEQQLRGDSLGDILMQSTGLSPSLLRQGVIAQILPTDFTMRLDSRELLLLLHIMILLQNINNGPWIFNQLLEIISEMLQCEASSILLADETERFLVVSYTSGTQKDEVLNKRISIDKGLAGWVYLHGKPSTIAHPRMDSKESESVHAAGDEILQSMLAVPIAVSGKRIGVIETLRKKEGQFTAHDLNLLSLAGNLLSNSLAAALWL
jgi:HD superfamily phosphodiesterase/putative methionine-R-sulfoxide reductase with GAF domain